MPFILKHRRPPEPWHEMRRRAPHTLLLPLYCLNWGCEWTAYFLGKFSFLEVLEYVGSFSILVAVILYFADSGDRVKQRHYQAWQVINTAQGKGGSGGRIEALRELNEDGVPLIGVDASGAFLQGVRLPGARLRRANFESADLRNANLSRAMFEEANLHAANFRDADLTSADLRDATLSDADLNGANLHAANLGGSELDRADLRNADLTSIADWQNIRSIRLADIHGARNAPPNFVQWAMQHGAIDIDNDDAWKKKIEDDESTRGH